jgi:tetratricopeptide (TPR) repeat protein
MTSSSWTSRGLERLDATLSTTQSPHQRRILMVKKACLYARLGVIDQASAALRSVRDPTAAYDPRLSAWMMFCEGLIEHFASLGEKALSGFKRAQAVSISVGDTELAALAAAWVAAAEVIAGNLEAVPPSLLQAFSLADERNHSALSRACLAVADLLVLSGQASEARPWFQRARHHAVEDGDIAMQHVGLFNDAAARVSSVVLADCRNAATERDILLASLAVDSASNLDRGLGLSHLTSMAPLLRAEVLMVQRRWDEAIGLFDAFLADTSVRTHDRLRPKYLAERAYCHAKLGERNQALHDLDLALKSVEACTDADDRLVLYARAAAVSAYAGRSDVAQQHEQAAARCEQAFLEHQAKLRDMLVPLLERIAATQRKKSPT